MNISTPVASEIASVDFAPLTTEEIKRISVKQIVNPLTFEPAEAGRVPIPIPGGLYDPALGAWESLRQRCATCNLDYKHCPGHVGHIALPIPVYNPLFFPQLLRLFRATCVYCFNFRASKAEVDRFVSKLRLIQYGLVAEADEIDDMMFKPKKKKGLSAEEGPGEELEEGDEDDGDIDVFIARRRKFVAKMIKEKGKTHGSTAKIAAISDARRAVLKQMVVALKGTTKCHRCKAHTPAMRPDGYAKIFEMPLPMKLRTANAQLGLRRARPVLDRKSKKPKAKVHQVDEGIADTEGDIEMRNAEEEVEEEDEEEEEEVANTPAGKTGGRLLPNIEVHSTLTRLFENEQDAVQVMFAPRTLYSKKREPVSADIFFLHALAVPPTKFRPPQAAGGELTENTANKALSKILQDCLVIRDHKTRSEGMNPTDAMNRLMRAFVDLQQDVNVFLDSSKGPIQGMAALGVDDGIKQKLEKKEGLFRKNMMGKRVNFAARSVISPDPNIETSEIGVPLVFATKLTYPEPVTDENFSRLAEYVKNGPDVWPGAVSIEMENGTVQKLPDDKEFNGRKRREELAKLLQTPDPLVGDLKPKKVYRHLLENDYVIMNRQPTLHKPSMMAHKARVLKKERTIRMHYANCNTYNADFDGDEMNMHLPQNAIAQAEAMEIAKTDLQYLAGTSGKPLRGLIQDHLVMGVYLTNRDTFFTREEYNQLMYSCLLPEQNGSMEVKGSGRIRTVPPTIFKPQPLWTGKQIITTILENIKPEHFDGLTLTSKSKVPGDRWYEGCEEDKVIFHKGYLVSGIMDKNQLGPSEYGFVHSVYEVYGPATAGRLLSIMGRLLTKLLHMRAHTCGMDDLRLTPEGNARRRKTLSGSKQVGRELAVEYVGLEEGNFREQELHNRLEEVMRDNAKHHTLDLKANASTKNFTSQVIRECLPDGLEKSFPKNNFQAMTVSGAKGSDVNASQISCLLGQQVLEGRRVPVMVSGKTLPCFKPYETDVRAGGYVTDRFLTGVRPQEFYFHCMAGREGLIDTAVKTSRSGYLQRCLIKGMEGIQVQYDNSVRDSDGSLVQFLYGEDGLDITKQRYLNQFKFCAQNLKSLLRRVADDEINADLGPTLTKMGEALHFDEGVSSKVKKALKRYKKAGELDASEVTTAEYSPARYVGAVSEKFYEAREAYIEKNPDQIISKSKGLVGPELSEPLSKGDLRNLLDLKYLRSIIEPGEAVGIVAGQSIGEPSTQMTLNTFHLAGHATKNVTLGIPRLREIVMTASAHIATPTMTLTMKPGVTEEQAKDFTKRSSKLVLAELIDGVTVTETATDHAKTYHVRIDFFPADEYKEEYSITKQEVNRVLKNRFVKALENAITKALDPKRAKSKSNIGNDDAMPEIGKSAGASEEESAPRPGDRSDDESDEESDDEGGDGDATAMKAKQRKEEADGYDGPDDDEQEIVDRLARADDEGLGDSEHSDVEIPAARKTDVVNANNVTHFEFDKAGQWCEIKLEYPAESPKVLMLAIVEKVCHDCVIHQLPNIGSLTKVPSGELSNAEAAAGVQKIAVEGVNFGAIWDASDIVDPDTIETNDIACVLRTYGVEAARNNIVKEMNAVFAGHGISVDIRHLNLIGDIMTRGGGYSPFNRQGLQSNVSPMLKMSFETTCNFLQEAAIEGDFDDLTSPSSRIVMGKINGVGTGSFDVLVAGL